jgi:accessory gene regulator protein AgrB
MQAIVGRLGFETIKPCVLSLVLLLHFSVIEQIAQAFQLLRRMTFSWNASTTTLCFYIAIFTMVGSNPLAPSGAFQSTV